ncbi:UbiA family prenyltransferase [Streptosporangium vulgare]|uniref:UbiA family prenyltransferase n=1 Tax=Streptosporangium vulgare TaxID=46190 RepID=UPI0031E2EA1C
MTTSRPSRLGPGPPLRAVRGLLLACHPGPTVAVTVLVTALAVASGRDAAGCALVAAAVLAGQLSIGWCNDAVDAARDAAAGRTGKPVASGAVGVRTVWAAALAALALCVPLSLASGPAAGAVHLTGVAAAWAYDLGLKATALSWLPYAVGFGSLPGFVTLGLPGHPWPAWWAVTAAALLGCGAHLANVLPDIPADLAGGVRGWPQRLGTARVRLLIPLAPAGRDDPARLRPPRGRRAREAGPPWRRRGPSPPRDRHWAGARRASPSPRRSPSPRSTSSCSSPAAP